MTHKGGKLETRAATGPLVLELDAVQYSLREGPCYDSVKADPLMIMESARTETRWPRYIPHALEKGLRSQMALRLFTDEGTLGGLNFYSTSSEGVEPDTVQMAELFAAHAALALGRARYEHQLQESVASRQVIGTAVGIVMQRYEIDEARAFEFLVRTSSTSNVKLRTIAEDLVSRTNQDYQPRS